MLEENTKKSPILEVEGLTVRRADGAALLEDVSLTVNAGEILGLVGESSAGKSMIGNAVAGLLPAGVVRTGGRIALEGREIQNLRPEEVRRIRGPEIGMILQDPLGSLNPLLTVGEHFRETFAAHGVRLTQPELRARSAALLREAGLPEPEKRLGQYPHELSGLRSRSIRFFSSRTSRRRRSMFRCRRKLRRSCGVLRRSAAARCCSSPTTWG